MANTIQLKRGDAADWTAADPTLAAGEFGFEVDTGKFKVGDGSTAWSALDYFEPAAAGAAWSYQGSASGYMGYLGVPSGTNVIDKFSFTSDGNATDVGNLTVARESTVGNSSAESGYSMGGFASPTMYNVVDKFPFAADGDATDVGDLTFATREGQGNSSDSYGYVTMGYNTSYGMSNQYEKLAYAVDGNSANVGTLTVTTTSSTNTSSPTNGYAVGGYNQQNRLDKFPFASDANATDVADNDEPRYNRAASSSLDAGYLSGGGYANGGTSGISKHVFASDSNASGVSNLAILVINPGGTQSTTHGYILGGNTPTKTDHIQKFEFASDSNAADIGNLTTTTDLAGQNGNQI